MKCFPEAVEDHELETRVRNAGWLGLAVWISLVAIVLTGNRYRFDLLTDWYRIHTLELEQ